MGLFFVAGIDQDMKGLACFFNPGFNVLGGENQEDQICLFASQSMEQDFKILGHRALIFLDKGFNTDTNQSFALYRITKGKEICKFFDLKAMTTGFIGGVILTAGAQP